MIARCVRDQRMLRKGRASRRAVAACVVGLVGLAAVSVRPGRVFLPAAGKPRGGGLVFFTLSFGSAFDSYGFMCVETAVRMNPDLVHFMVMTSNKSSVNTTRLSRRARRVLDVRRGLKRVHDQRRFNYVQLRAQLTALRLISKLRPVPRGVIYTDLDVLHLAPFPPHTFGSSFTVGVVTRAPGVYGALNAGLILYHGANLAKVRTWLNATLGLYRTAGYFDLERCAPGHSCCMQHVFEHALDLELGTPDWKRALGDVRDFRSTLQLQCSTLETGDFVLRGLGIRRFLASPQTEPRIICSRPMVNSTALHYKGGWKAHMSDDFRTLLAESAPAVIARYHEGVDPECRLSCCGCCSVDNSKPVVVANCTARPDFGPLSDACHPPNISAVHDQAR